MLIHFYLFFFILTVGSLYLSLTVSHIYLYFILLTSLTYALKNYTYLFYVVYLNFYWSLLVYNVFFILNFTFIFFILKCWLAFLFYYLYS